MSPVVTFNAIQQPELCALCEDRILNHCYMAKLFTCDDLERLGRLTICTPVDCRPWCSPRLLHLRNNPMRPLRGAPWHSSQSLSGTPWPSLHGDPTLCVGSTRQ